jgi:hypothetical protein
MVSRGARVSRLTGPARRAGVSRAYGASRADASTAASPAEPSEEVLARQEHRNKLVLQIGDVGLLVWLSFALANTGPVSDMSKRLRPAMSPPRE